MHTDVGKPKSYKTYTVTQVFLMHYSKHTQLGLRKATFPEAGT